MSSALTVTRAVVCAACLVIASHVHAQAPARGTPFIAEAHYTSTLATNGQNPPVIWEVARDRSGRMRIDRGREVVIADPVSARYLHLDTHARTVLEVAVSPRPAANATSIPEVPLATNGILARAVDGSQVKSLGTRVIEGYLSEGRLITRSVNVDPRRPESRVTVEMEIWTSSEIGPLIVNTRTSQGHEQQYALKNIRLEEAPAARFKAPAAFTRITATPSQRPDAAGIPKP